MARYQFVDEAGPHFDNDNVRYDPGDVIESDRDLLTELKGKVRLLPEVVPPPAPKNSPPAPPAEESKEEAFAATDNEETTLVDSTDKFPDAIKAGVKVLRDGNKFFVVPDEDGAKALNEEPLKSKKDVEAFITDILEK